MNLCYHSQISDRWPQSSDGEFGPSTRLALIRVQHTHRMSADGGHGPLFAAAMKQRTKASTHCEIFYTCDRIRDA